MRPQQFQCVGNAGCARVVESRGFHRWRPPRPEYRQFFARLDGDHPQRSSLFIERLFPCRSTFGLVMMAATKQVHSVIPGREPGAKLTKSILSLGERTRNPEAEQCGSGFRARATGAARNDVNS